MKPEIEEYRKYVERFDLPTEAQRELVLTVWQMMESFVDRAFGVDPTQQARASRIDKDANGGRPMIEFRQESQKEGQTISGTFRRTSAVLGRVKED